MYDVIIIGGGPGGFTAALYCARAGFDTLVLEKISAGGQMCLTSQIDNYPGFENGVDGFELGQKMKQGAERFGVKVSREEVASVDLKNDVKKVTTAKNIYEGKCVVIATGADHKHLGIEDEEKLIGRGVGYCATCDGMFYRGKTVAIVGGGNSAAADALFLSNICEKVILIHRRDSLRATKVYHNPLQNAKNVEFCWNSTVEKFLFDEKLNGVVVKDVKTGEESTINCDGLFISIGRQPATKLFEGQVDIDSYGYIVADETTKTNIDGVFAVGDVRTKTVRQIVTATADGATAAYYIEEYLMDK